MTANREIKNQILSEIDSVVKNPEFIEWLAGETVPDKKDLFVVFNNSFLFRGTVQTKKSNKYLACRLSKSRKINVSDCFIISDLKMNSPYKIIIDNPSIKKSTIIGEIRDEVNDLGDLLFVLIGEIFDDVVIEEKINNTNFKIIRLNPLATETTTFIDDVIELSDCSDKNKIWNEIDNHCSINSISYPDNFSNQVDTCISKLQRSAYSRIAIPSSIDSSKTYLIDKIILVIDDQINDYSRNLPNISSDSSAFNEILRISYNFVSDISKLLHLVIHVCDLKPLVLWMNIDNFINLDLSFKNLPTGFSNIKPSLKIYESLIKNARNKTFHQLFPFNKSLELNVGNLNEVTLRMFANYSNKRDNVIEYKDKQLAELLLDFTRVVEEQVDDEFWIENEKVMICVIDLLKGISESLKILKK